MSFFQKLWKSVTNHKYLLIFLILVIYYVYLYYTSYSETQRQVDAIDALNIRGKYIDKTIHQLNIFEWTNDTIVTRTMQGLADVEYWTIDPTNNRYIIKSYTPYHYGYYDKVQLTITIKDSANNVLTTLYREPITLWDTATNTSFVCTACSNASKSAPTYSNFATNYQLVTILPADQAAFAASLDVLRECGMYQINLIPVGPSSNTQLATGGLAVANDYSCFFTIPSINYNMLTTQNGIIPQQIPLSRLPKAYCGSM